MLRVCSFLAALPLVAACTSAPTAERAATPADAASSRDASKAMCMTFTYYKSGVRMELVNTSHTDPLQQYSKLSESAARKVQTDEMMDGLWNYLKEQGYAREAKQGRAPDMASGSLLWSLQVAGPDGVSYVAEPAQASSSASQRLRVLSKAFLDTYNATQAWQAVKIEKGKEPFPLPEMPARKDGRN